MTPSSSERNPVEALAEEFLAQRRGEKPTLEEYTARHPELADDIRDLFPALLLVEDVGDGSLAATGPHLEAAPPIEQLGDYRILREIGRGGMGVVYEAEQVSLGRRVALKVLPPHLLQDVHKLRRFEREARAAARLHHTNIVPVFGVGCHEGTSYYVMQFIHGQGLDQVLAELKWLRQVQAPTAPVTAAAEVAQALLTGHFQEKSARGARSEEPAEPGHDAGDQATPSSPSGDSSSLLQQSSLTSESGRAYWNGIARIGIQVAEALAHAHGQGILHRDIKPSNLLLDVHGTVWVTDFGLAKATSDGDNLTHTGDIVGTIRYMAPERFEGTSDARCDLYSLGLTLYELLVQQPAFGEKQRHQLVQQVLHAEPVPPRQLNATIPRDLETVVLKAMARDPRQRYQTAADLAEDLQRFVDDRPIRARRVRWPERCWRWCRRNRLVAGLMASVALSLALVIVVVSVGYANARRLAFNERRVRQEAQRSLYASCVQMAQQAWEGFGIDSMLQLLEDADRRQPGDEDLRGFEWHYLWRLAHTEVLTLQGHSGRVTSVAFSPKGQRLASVSTDGMVKLWETAPGKELLSFRGYEVSSGYEHEGSPSFSVTFSPDGHRLASGGGERDRTVRLWEFASGKELLTLRGHGGAVNSVAFSPDGGRLATASADRTVKLWEAVSGKELLTLRGHGNAVTSIAFSLDGLHLASVSEDGTTKLWDLATGADRPSLEGNIKSAAFSPDGMRLVTAGANRPVRLWDVATGENLLTLKELTGMVRMMAFSADGQRLASTGGPQDRTVKLWDVASGKELLTLRGRNGVVSSFAFSPDGQRLAVASTDRTVKLWEVANGKELLTLKGDAGAVNAVAFSPNGQSLATASEDGTISVWEAVHPPQEMLRQRALHEQAMNLVESLFTTHVRQAEVIQAIRGNLFLHETLRQAALTLAARDGPRRLDQASWAVVCQPGATAEAYGLALQQAEEACRLEPHNGSYLTTLGVAQYRVGQYAVAVETLARAAQFQAMLSNGDHTVPLAFQAMAQYQLGQKEQALATRNRLRQELADQWATNAEGVTALREAELLIQEGKSVP